MDVVYALHTALGCGLLENVHELCFCHELSQPYSSYRRQVFVAIVFVYDGTTFHEWLRLEVVVEELVICELKALETMHPVFTAQLLTYLNYLKLNGKRVAFLINLNVLLIKDGIKRVVL